VDGVLNAMCREPTDDDPWASLESGNGPITNSVMRMDSNSTVSTEPIMTANSTVE